MSGLNPKLGVCYYPEHWPEAQWAEDALQMVEMGLSWVRIGEFAWSRMEAMPGVFTWDWLDRAIEVLGKAGLNVVLGTPTATPPRWMVDKHPDMLAVGADGAVRKFGSRRHYCFSVLTPPAWKRFLSLSTCRRETPTSFAKVSPQALSSLSARFYFILTFFAEAMQRYCCTSEVSYYTYYTQARVYE